ncbi:nemo-like kinase, type 1 isoform X2 [Alosa alosa]|uniref:nemo-like kinase, type 1 isoform X2 n=1 Tax=Alosa alosa TaxID=278164 RepID=UPI0020150E44|nr:nemo-like kinase, type 1 isoform X2 [Alosa alosa]
MAFHGTGRQAVCGNLFPGSEIGHKYFCVSTSAPGTTSTGQSASTTTSGPIAPAGTPRHPASLIGSTGGGAAVPQPHSNPASEVPSAAEMEPDRPIGYGAFGVVWSVTDPRDGRKVALKKMPNVFQNLVSCKRVFRELRMLCFFKHDNVLSALDILQPPQIDCFEEIYVITELMQSDLHKVIVSPQALTTDHIKVFLYQILRGLKYLHSAGILHRDIKPGNLLVNSNCLLKLDLITDLLGTPPLSAMATACEGARAHILRGPHKPPSLSVLYMLSDAATHEAVHLLCRMLVFDPAKRISGSDALSHPYLDEGRLRYHTCMCQCCYSLPSGRVYTRDFEPPAARAFSHSYEESMLSVWQGKELIHRFITEHQQGKRVPLCINPQSAAFKTFIRSTAWHSSKVSRKEER